MKFSSYSIQKKLMLLLAFSIIVPSLIFCLFSYNSTTAIIRKNYETQTLNSLNASAQSISSKISIADTSVRQIHFDTELIELLSTDGRTLTPSMRIEVSRKLFNFMEQIFLSVPEASQVHLNCFNLRRTMLLTDNLYSYEKEHIYVRSERAIATEPYRTYITPTHLQYDYAFTNQSLNQYPLVYSVNIMIYQIPSVSDPIGKLTIDIPIESLEKVCDPLVSDKESIQIVDSNRNIIYSSDDSRIMGTLEDAALLKMIEGADESGADPISYSSDSIFFCVPIESGTMDWYLLKTSPTQYIYMDVQKAFSKTMLGLVSCCVFMLLFSLVTIIRFTKPLKQLTNYTNAVQEGDLTAHLSHYIVYTKQDEIGSLIKSIQKMMYTINHFTIWQYQLELANRTNELKALQAQINPHFIYNTLQCIATQALESDNMKLYNAIAKLGQMMHYSMDTSTQLVPFHQEVQHCANYVQLQQMRFEQNNFTFNQKISPAVQDLVVPKMILQPLIENSFKHGHVLKLADSFLTLRADIRDREFYIVIEDNGNGIGDERLKEVQDSLEQLRTTFCNPKQNQILDYLKNSAEPAEDFPTGGPEDVERQLEQKKENIHATNNIGIGNVYMRLLLNYNNQCSLSIRRNRYNGVSIEIVISMNAPQLNGESV